MHPHAPACARVPTQESITPDMDAVRCAATKDSAPCPATKTAIGNRLRIRDEPHGPTQSGQGPPRSHSMSSPTLAAPRPLAAPAPSFPSERRAGPRGSRAASSGAADGCAGGRARQARRRGTQVWRPRGEPPRVVEPCLGRPRALAGRGLGRPPPRSLRLRRRLATDFPTGQTRLGIGAMPSLNERPPGTTGSGDTP